MYMYIYIYAYTKCIFKCENFFMRQFNVRTSLFWCGEFVEDRCRDINASSIEMPAHW